jgi:hypothetical protein
MRALTSLAGHILGSHPQINGYYEMHLGYQDGMAYDSDSITVEEIREEARCDGLRVQLLGT